MRQAAAPIWWSPPTRSASGSATPSWRRIPYVLVVGDDDVLAGTVGVNPRGGEVERGVDVSEFVARFAEEVAVAETDALSA